MAIRTGVEKCCSKYAVMKWIRRNDTTEDIVLIGTFGNLYGFLSCAHRVLICNPIGPPKTLILELMNSKIVEVSKDMKGCIFIYCVLHIVLISISF